MFYMYFNSVSLPDSRALGPMALVLSIYAIRVSFDPDL